MGMGTQGEPIGELVPVHSRIRISLMTRLTCSPALNQLQGLRALVRLQDMVSRCHQARAMIRSGDWSSTTRRVGRTPFGELTACEP